MKKTKKPANRALTKIDRDNLVQFRRMIDEIDRDIVHLLNERAFSAKRIGQIKKKTGTKVHDPMRENEVMARVRHLNKSFLLSDRAIRSIYQRIIGECLALQR
jgi:chorismate mutase